MMPVGIRTALPFCSLYRIGTLQVDFRAFALDGVVLAVLGFLAMGFTSGNLILVRLLIALALGMSACESDNGAEPGEIDGAPKLKHQNPW